VSKEAKELVKKLLTYDPAKRISAAEALNDPWILKMTHRSTVQPASDLPALTAMSQLTKFHADSTLKQAAMTYIVSQLVDDKEKRELQKVFQKLDKNGDGTLSKQELVEGYQAVRGTAVSKAQIEEMFDGIDINKSGSIDYSEFLLAAMNDKKILSEANIKGAFDVMDKVYFTSLM
jgi:calcium-dependent protein kinase